MEIGPFSINDLNALTELFSSKNITVELLIDEQAKQAILARFHEGADVSPRTMAGKLDLKIAYFEIAEADFEKVRGDLEKFGFVKASDGSYELGEDS